MANGSLFLSGLISMAVYVDDVRHPYRGMICCHMWADTEDELHAMARAIGLRPEWVQRPPWASWLHYDVSKTLKARAVQRGAILTDKYGPLEWKALRNPDINKMVEALQQIEKARARERARISNQADE